MTLIVPRGARNEAPQAPYEIREAVELFARESGRTGSIEFAVGPNVWLVKLSLKPNDPTLSLYRQGKVADLPVEVVWLQEPNPHAGKVVGWNGAQPVRGGPYRALDIHQMGASGVRAFLDKGNTWSGRGQTVEQIARAAFESDERLREANYNTAREENREEAKARRRSFLGIPFLSVGIDLKGKS